jgi:hypothetical protein
MAETVESPEIKEFIASGEPVVEFDDVSIGFEGMKF